MDSNIIPLQQLYLSALVQVANGEKLSAVQQDTGGDSGRLWLVGDGSTVPHAMIAYKFGLDSVSVGLIHRDERALERAIKYAEGLDGFLEELQKFLRAGKLAAPKGSKAALKSV